jgi:hypothetical protein
VHLRDLRPLAVVDGVGAEPAGIGDAAARRMPVVDVALDVEPLDYPPQGTGVVEVDVRYQQERILPATSSRKPGGLSPRC